MRAPLTGIEEFTLLALAQSKIILLYGSSVDF